MLSSVAEPEVQVADPEVQAAELEVASAVGVAEPELVQMVVVV